MARQIDIMQLGFRGYGLGIWVTCGFDKLEEKEKKRRERLGQARRRRRREGEVGV